MKTQRWIDLSARAIYLGSIKMSDGVERLALIDMDDSVPAERLREAGFRPFEGSPKFERGLYYLDGVQALRPSQLAAAVGIDRCPVVEVRTDEIDTLFRAKCQQKFQANINAAFLRAHPLGKNKLGQDVFEGSAGRFIRTSPNEAIAERTAAGRALGRTHFLYASTDHELRECADAFVEGVLGGRKATWTDLVRFGRILRGRDATGEEMFRLQEAVEAAGYSAFTSLAKQPDERTFAVAQQLYFGLPTAPMRTAESLHLQQFSTPLPLSVVAQRLLIGHDNLAGKSVLDPAVGNGGLVHLLPRSASIYATDLDNKRLGAMERYPHIRAVIGDATLEPFRDRFGVAEGFDYTIMNPPFGPLKQPQRFDKIEAVRRVDHFIALRALEARKANGRSVMIIGADRARSDGVVEGTAKSFLNYLHDHYEVHGCVEVDGRLYLRTGAGYNVRILVVGARLASRRNATVPEQLPVLTTYDELWAWSTRVVEVCAEADRALSAAREAARSPGAGGPQGNSAKEQEAGAVTSELVADATSVVGVGGVAVGAVAPAFMTTAGPDSLLPYAPEGTQPWEMTAAQWRGALFRLQQLRLDVAEGAATSAALEEQVAARHSVLLHGVPEWYARRARAGDRDAQAWVARATPPTHRDVVQKALDEALQVPAHVLAEYPGLGKPAPTRRVNTYQAPYQAASKIGMTTAMIPINMAGATYGALRRLEAKVGSIDGFVAEKLRYDLDDLERYFSPEQVDAVALAIQAVEAGRGIINADQTGMGKGRFVAAMMRYARLRGKTPVFVTIKAELFTDIFRDIEDIGSRDLFKRLFIFNEGVRVMHFGTEDAVLYPATSALERQRALDTMAIEPDVDMVLATYSQFQRAVAKNRKAQLLGTLSEGEVTLFMDEAHVAAGASNTSESLGVAVANCDAVVYSSATPLKGIDNFSIYHKVFPASVDLKSLPDTLRVGGEALQEAISANMASDGVLIRREHDFSRLTFVTRTPDDKRREANLRIADELADILGGMSYLAGDVSKQVSAMNKDFTSSWEDIPESERKGQRMRASSMHFGSRLFAINRQFLLCLTQEEALAAALEDLQAGRKPVIAVEATGESLLRQVLARRAGIDALESELADLEERDGDLSEAEQARRVELQRAVLQAFRDVRLDNLPQFRDLLEIMLQRVGEIKVHGRYGGSQVVRPRSDAYAEEEERLRGMIAAFPDMALAPLDHVKHVLGLSGFAVAEVSGRTASLSMVDGKWAVTFHAKADAVAQVAGFQNGKYDAAIITRSGSTGISLHATDRFEDSDTRQRNFIALQKAANIAEFLQWLGRVDRKDQVCVPLITMLDTGLPAEARVTMMHNAKLRKLSANTTSNRENGNVEASDVDLLNQVGEGVALEWLINNPDVARELDIDLPNDDALDRRRASDDCPYVNKLLGRLMMVRVAKQQEILDVLTRNFADKVEEMEQRGENPFKVDVFEWGASTVSEEELQSGVLRGAGSTFDEPVKIATLAFEVTVKPLRSAALLSVIQAGLEAYRARGAGVWGSVQDLGNMLRDRGEVAVRKYLPENLRQSEESLGSILLKNEAPAAMRAYEKLQFLRKELSSFVPGAYGVFTDPFKGDVDGLVTAIQFPGQRDDPFLLSKYRLQVVCIGDERPRELSLATLFNQEQSLALRSSRAIDPERMKRYPFVRDQAEQILRRYDEAPDGKLMRRAHVLQGNIFRACEMALQQRFGAPILYSDAGGNRQRAVRLKDAITPAMVQAVPVGMDAEDVHAYVTEFLRPDHLQHRRRTMFGALTVYDRAVHDMKKGDGVMLQVLNGGKRFRLTVPGTKARAGGLLTDGRIFDIGEQSASDGLKLKLQGTRAAMTAELDVGDLPELLRRLQAARHVGKFYVPNADHVAIKALKQRYAEAAASCTEQKAVPCAAEL